MRKFFKFTFLLAISLIFVTSAIGVSAAQFNDVDYSTVEGDAVNALVELGITNGTSDTTFGSKELVTRQQMALFIYRLMNNGETTSNENATAFNDVTDPTYFAAISWANKEGIINGTSDTTFNPKGSITLQDAYTMLIRALGYPGLEYPMGYVNLATHSSFKLNEGLSKSINNKQALTRGNVAVLLYNSYNEKSNAVTNYTSEDIKKSNGRLVSIGNGFTSSVVAAFNDDFTEVVITKNGENSDGVMLSRFWDDKSPMQNHADTLKFAVVKSGVKTLGRRAFSSCNKLSNIVLSSGITKIEGFAFAGTGITSITLPEGVNIEGGLFSDCTLLSKVNLPASLTTIPSSAFAWCPNLKTINIPTGVTAINQCAFRYSGLESINIPYGVTNVGNRAFENCENLTNVIIPNTVTTIDEEAFLCCYALTNINLPDSLEKIGKDAFYECTGLIEVVIPKKVTTVSESAFGQCSKLEKVTISGGVTTIEAYAFYGCDSLKNLILPTSLTSIDSYAFDCFYLFYITFDGTCKEWNGISLDKHWKGGFEKMVKCKDGNIVV